MQRHEKIWKCYAIKVDTFESIYIYSSINPKIPVNGLFLENLNDMYFVFIIFNTFDNVIITNHLTSNTKYFTNENILYNCTI